MGCQRCVSCGQAQSWSQPAREGVAHSQDWPGSIQTPSLYFLLGARRLQYQLSHLPRDGAAWRETDSPALSALLLRRQAGGLTVLVPASFTNIEAGDVLTYAGSVCVPLPALLSRGFAKSNSSCGSAISSGRGSSCRDANGGRRSSRPASRLARRLGTSCACLDSLSSASAVTRDTPPPRGLYWAQPESSSRGSEASWGDGGTPPAQQVKRSRSTTSLAAPAAPSSGGLQVVEGSAASSALGPRLRMRHVPCLPAVGPAAQAGQRSCRGSSGQGAMQGRRATHEYPLRPPPPPPRDPKQTQLRPPCTLSLPCPRPCDAPHRQHTHQQQQSQQQQRPTLLAGLQILQAPQQTLTVDERRAVHSMASQLHQRTWCSSLTEQRGDEPSAAVGVGSPEGASAAPLTQSTWEWQWDNLVAGGKRKVIVG
ncbi:hypothetical protein N2152v2_008264 [Parachlorella kessleri]